MMYPWGRGGHAPALRCDGCAQVITSRAHVHCIVDDETLLCMDCFHSEKPHRNGYTTTLLTRAETWWALGADAASRKAGPTT